MNNNNYIETKERTVEIDNALIDIRKCASLIILIEGAFESNTGHYKGEIIIESLSLIRETLEKTYNKLEELL